MEFDQAIEELLQVLLKTTKPEVKAAALDHILGLTGNDIGRDKLKTHEQLLKSIVRLAVSNEEQGRDNPVGQKALQIIVNLSAEDQVANWLTDSVNSTILISELWKMATAADAEDTIRNDAVGVLSNMTRERKRCQNIWEQIQNDADIDRIVDAICKDQNTNNWVGLLANLSQLDQIRKELMDHVQQPILRLLGLLSNESETKRQNVVAILRNCCFDTENHIRLLTEFDILSYLLLPLAGPEEFDQDDAQSLPLDLQYLGPDKTREPNEKIRQMLVEAITQLCATGAGRKYIKEKRAYVIMRELHKWEKVPEVIVAVLNLIDILIGDEPPHEMENLKNVDIPQDLIPKFEKEDQEFLQSTREDCQT